MKKFVSENWYKMMIGSSLLMASFGFMVHSVSPAMADVNNQKLNVNSNYKMVPTNADGSINVKLSDEQLSKIIPKNADGSINIKMAPNAIMDVNIKEISMGPTMYKIPGTKFAALPVWTINHLIQ